MLGREGPPLTAPTPTEIYRRQVGVRADLEGRSGGLKSIGGEEVQGPEWARVKRGERVRGRENRSKYV